MKVPWLSVIMPTYNGSSYLSQALESIISQGDQDLEVLAVDDGSTDDTVAILRAYSNRLPLKVVEQKRIGNWVAATNRGLEMATGEYVSLLHQDDVWMPDRLRSIRGHLEAAVPRALLVHPVWYVDSKGRSVGRWRCPLPARTPLPPSVVTERLLVQNFISVLGTVFPRKLALEEGRLDERLWYTADWDLWLRLARQGTTLYLPRMLGAFRVHSKAMTATRTEHSDEFRWQLEAVLLRHLPDVKMDRPTRQVVEAAARFSVDVNVALAALLHRRRANLGRLVQRSFTLPPAVWRRYLRDSRILERVSSRLRARLGLRIGRGAQR
jgi:glycosyltransferase involved in cell wall biosynthesis